MEDKTTRRDYEIIHAEYEILFLENSKELCSGRRNSLNRRPNSEYYTAAGVRYNRRCR